MDSVSFKSYIHPVSVSAFNDRVAGYGASKLADYPWTVKQTVIGKQAYTKNVLDCTAFGVTDGGKVMLMHICPTVKENFNLYKIDQFLKDKLKHFNKEYLQGFILGSQNYFSDFSPRVFEFFEKFAYKYDIPSTKLRCGRTDTHVAYDVSKDEWLLGNSLVPELEQNHFPKGVLDSLFEEVSICKLDEIV